MKITVSRDAISTFCALSRQITGQKTSNSFTRCIHLSIVDGKLHAKATNLEQYMRHVIDCKISSPDGDALIDAEILSKITKLSSEQELSIDSDGNSVVLKSLSDVWSINAPDNNDFPRWIEMQKKSVIKMAGIDFCSGLKKCAPMIASEKGRYALNGVNIIFSNGRAEFCGTDGRRLAMIRYPASFDGECSALLPKSACETILSMASEGDVEIQVDDSRILVRSGITEMYSRLIEGQFPDYKTVIPTNLDKTAKFERGDLVNALEKAKLLTTQESQAVRMSFSPGHLSISSKSASLGTSEISCHSMYNGEHLDIGFDPVYLLDALEACDSDFVELKIHEKDDGVIIHSGREDQEMYIVMPIDI